MPSPLNDRLDHISQFLFKWFSVLFIIDQTNIGLLEVFSPLTERHPIATQSKDILDLQHKIARISKAVLFYLFTHYTLHIL